MKKLLITILAALACLCAAAQSPEEFKRMYERQTAVAGSSGLGVRAILESWEKAYPQDTAMFEAAFAYNISKGRNIRVVRQPGRTYLGKKPVLSLQDSTGVTVNYFEETVYDEECFEMAMRALDNAIKLAPDNIGYRFNEIAALLDYEGGSPEMAAEAIISMIYRNYADRPRWNLDGRALTHEEFVTAIKEYSVSLWQIGTPVARDRFLKISQIMHGHERKDPAFLDNIGSYYQVTGNPKTAARYYRKALKLDPDDYPANHNLKIINNKQSK